jgi:hypothetical protein
MGKMDLTAEEDTFIRRSYEEVEKREQAEKERRERELKLAQDKLKANQRTIKIGFGLGFIAFVAAVFAFILNSRTNQAFQDLAANQQELLEAQLRDWKNNYDLFRVSGDNQNRNGEFQQAANSYVNAERFLARIDSFLVTPEGKTIKKLEESPLQDLNDDLRQEVSALINYNLQMIDSARLFNQHDSMAEIAFAEERLVDAMIHLNNANAIKISLSKNREIQNKISDIRGRLLPVFIQYINDAVTLEKVRSCDLAKSKIQSARRLEPYIDRSSISENILEEKSRIERACGI